MCYVESAPAHYGKQQINVSLSGEQAPVYTKNVPAADVLREHSIVCYAFEKLMCA